jgi:hypothetical protein
MSVLHDPVANFVQLSILLQMLTCSKRVMRVRVCICCMAIDALNNLVEWLLALLRSKRKRSWQSSPFNDLNTCICRCFTSIFHGVQAECCNRGGVSEASFRHDICILRPLPMLNAQLPISAFIPFQYTSYELRQLPFVPRVKNASPRNQFAPPSSLSKTACVRRAFYGPRWAVGRLGVLLRRQFLSSVIAL